MYLRQNSFCFTSIDVSCGGTEGFPRTIPRVTSSYAYKTITDLNWMKRPKLENWEVQNSEQGLFWDYSLVEFLETFPTTFDEVLKRL